MKFSLKLPEKTDNVILGNDSIDIVNIFTENSITHKVHTEDSVTIYINIKFIIKYAINFIKLLKSCNILQLIYNNYHLTILQLMSPKFVYTQTDNNTLIHWLSKYEKKIRFISIQNGLRTKHEFRYFKNKHLENYNHDIFFMFGNHEESMYKKMNINITKPMKLGSLKLGMFLEKKYVYHKKYTICLVSEFMEEPNKNSKHYGIEKELCDYEFDFHKILNQYIVDTDQKILIALNKPNRDDQIKYFSNIFGDNAIFHENTNIFSSYEAVCKSELTIGFFSTLLIESLALGNKVLSVDTSNSDRYFDYPSCIKHDYLDYSSFKSYVDKIIDMNISDYNVLTKDISKYSMTINHSRYPHNELLRIATGSTKF